MNITKNSLRRHKQTCLTVKGILQNTEPWQSEAMTVVLTNCQAREAPFLGSLSLRDLDCFYMLNAAEYRNLHMRGGSRACSF